MDIEGLGVAHVVVAPHPVDERRALEHPPGVLHQQRQHLELLEWEIDLLSVHPHLVARYVELHRTLDQQVPGQLLLHHFAAPGLPAQHRPHASDQLAHAVGLGDVVVSAHLEAHDRVDLGRLGGDHDDRHLAVLAEFATDVDPRHGRQHHVEQNEVGVDLVEASECLTAVPGDLHLETLAAETHRERIHEGLFVLDDQHPGRRQALLGTTLGGCDCSIHVLVASGADRLTCEPEGTGSSMVSTLPRPSVDSTRTCPP